MPTPAEYQARIESLDWSGLIELWEALERGATPQWEPGRAFEYLVLRAFQLDGAEVRWPYSVQLFDEEVEQIDGAIHCAGMSCLVESKDQIGDVAIAPIAKLRNQLLRRPASTIGLMFSRTAFTASARTLAHFSMPQTILLWTGQDMQHIFSRRQILELLVLKYRASVEEGLPLFQVDEETEG